MKKFLLRILIFVFLSGALLVVVSRFDNLLSGENNPNIIRLHDAPRQGKLDILFTGSSYTYSAIMPTIFDTAGFSTYNLGTATAGPYFNELIIDDYLNTTSQRPDYVVIDISLLTFSEKSDNWSSYPIHRYLNNPFSNEKLALKYNLWDLYLPLTQKSVVKGVKNCITRLMELFGKNGGNCLDTSSSEYKIISEGKGFEKDCTIADSARYIKENSIFSVLGKSDFSKEKVHTFEKIIKKYSEMGITVVVVQLPTNILETYFSEDYKSKFATFIDKLKEKKEISFIDARLPDKITDEDYRNADHCNCYGAIKVSLYLLEQMKKLKNQ